MPEGAPGSLECRAPGRGAGGTCWRRDYGRSKGSSPLLSGKQQGGIRCKTPWTGGGNHAYCFDAVLRDANSHIPRDGDSFAERRTDGAAGGRPILSGPSGVVGSRSGYVMSHSVLLLSRYGRKGPSSRVRHYNYLPALEQAGLRVTVAPFLDDEYLERLYGGQRRGLRLLARAYWRRLRQIVTARR